MYSRSIQEAQYAPILEGNPSFGTWDEPFKDVNLINIHKPFKAPLTKDIRDLRLKEWQAFHIHDGRYYLSCAFLNLKYYRLAHVVLWDSETREKMVFRKTLPFGSWHIPRNLSNASVTSRSFGFFFRVHSWLEADVIELDIDIESRKNRPSFTAHLELSLPKASATPLVVCLPFDEKRCMYAYKNLGSVRGDCVFGGRHITLKPESSSGLFYDFKGYYPYRVKNLWANGFGHDSQNRRFGFSLAENQTIDSNGNNENVLWIEGRMYPLPPVRITISSEGEWVIQDLEGMVDLSFSPREDFNFSWNLFLTRSEFFLPIGVFNGMIAGSDLEKISVRNLLGRCEKVYLRV